MLDTLTNPLHEGLDWEEFGGVLVIRLNTCVLRGEEDIVRLFAQVDSLIEAHGRRLVLDLMRVEAFSSYGIGKLLGVHKRLRAAGGRLALCGLTPKARTLLSTMRLDRLLHLYEHEVEARNSFGAAV
jgi:anti-sigma B factor antagonist